MLGKKKADDSHEMSSLSEKRSQIKTFTISSFLVFFFSQVIYYHIMPFKKMLWTETKLNSSPSTLTVKTVLF